MNKFFRLIAFFSLFLIFSCGYKPVFQETNYNFSINIKSISGDNEVNNHIENMLSRLSGKKTFNVELDSIIKKNIILQILLKKMSIGAAREI